MRAREELNESRKEMLAELMEEVCPDRLDETDHLAEHEEALLSEAERRQQEEEELGRNLVNAIVAGVPVFGIPNPLDPFGHKGGNEGKF